jgi:hypothetical protein
MLDFKEKVSRFGNEKNLCNNIMWRHGHFAVTWRHTNVTPQPLPAESVEK